MTENAAYTRPKDIHLYEELPGNIPDSNYEDKEKLKGGADQLK